jgi:hypothetical protein
MFAFTAIDNDLLRPTAGRDPLGVQAIWQHRARDLVPHLTASTGRHEGFFLLLTALAWWPKFAADQRFPEGKLIDYFMLVEQAVARACHVAQAEWPLPGTRSLNSNTAKGVYIGMARGDYLLDAQASNGVWGLYRRPAINAGLIDENNRIVELGSYTAEAIRTSSSVMQRLLGKVAAVMKSGGDVAATLAQINCPFVSDLTRVIKHDNDGAHNELLKQVLQKRLLKPDTPVLTHKLVKLMREFADARLLDPEDFINVAISEIGTDEPALQHAMDCERYLAVIEGVFDYLCATPQASLRKVTSDLDKILPMARLRKAQQKFRSSGSYGSDLALERHTSLATLDLVDTHSLLAGLIDHHQAVSKGRGVDAWVSLLNGKLDFRRRADPPSPETLDPSKAWRNSYYLWALQGLVNGLYPVRSAKA